ncbi:Putative efflux system component YknX [Caulifigura coniformis]|uniref:Efflux system component YknX n=1 Tax=Caulifigura coniformis TaxID=2527983 RepID=A0A517S957_9PLAN|nr:HlyD family efflux transporter periplasmic adaptor subunit [Caulifigura coniformis]QDT52660.1 Putative efflux system component YknX [Caulifigura coniformis]
MPEGHSSIEVTVRRGRRLRRWAVLLGVIGLGVSGLIGGRAALSEPEPREVAVPVSLVAPMPGTTVARRAPLSLVLTQRGALDCVQKTTLFSRVEWETKLTYVLPEGAFVKKGDVVASLDVSKLREEYGDEQVDVMTAETALAAAEDALLLQRIDNENLLASAGLKKDLTALSLEGYTAAEYPYQVRDLERQIAAAEDALHTARERFDFTQRLRTKGYAQAVEVDKVRLTLNQAEQKFNDLSESLRVLEKHQHQRTLKALEGDARTAEHNLTRAESLAELRLLARQRIINSQRQRLMRQKQQFDWATRMLAECEIRAPHDGQVVYAQQRDAVEPIGEGVKVKFLQPIAVIPDRSKMKVTVRVHETQRRLLSVGLPSEIRTDADPRRVIRGTVAGFSQFPVTGRFPNYDLREYEVVVNLEEGVELTPGLTARVDLIAASKADALQVPFEAVTEVDDCHLVFVRQGTDVVPCEVTLGERSEDHVEILAGLDEGQLVVLDPRERCQDAIVSWERSRRDVLQSVTVLGE